MTTQTTITIYNKHLGADRRDIYYPTRISEASYAESHGSDKGTGYTDKNISYKLRIPVRADTGGKPYLPESLYRELQDGQTAWTLSQLDLITLGEPLIGGPADERTLREAAKAVGKDIIQIREYADNTKRGSALVQHWRIGGA